ncbi:MAG: hemolysin III family protein [Spirochaetaceae bacterium]|jgi:hemolysin III|nr:hemolysin III family protein [Spirochaetaceae bacterium]
MNTKLPLPSEAPGLRTPGEEIANAVSHGFGVLLAAAGLVVLLTLRGNGWVYAVFAATMIAMFLASTLYHAIRHERAKRVFKIIDHAGIYLFIAGTCTPIYLLGVKGVLGWVCFGIEWVSALGGILLYALNCKILKKLEIAVYLLMGWAIVFCLFRLIGTVPFISVAFLLAGGLVYSLGILWYIKPSRPGSHTVWHIFVLAGAASHWCSVWFI